MTRHISKLTLMQRTVQQADTMAELRLRGSGPMAVPSGVAAQAEEGSNILHILVTELIAQADIDLLRHNTEQAQAEEGSNILHILVTERIAQTGIDLLHEELPEALIYEQYGLDAAGLRVLIRRANALIVRSQTQVTADVLAAAPHLQVIGRAGTGVDNIDVEAASQRGIAVVNAPTGSVTAVAEHTIAMLLALARHLPAASRSMRAGKWEKPRFQGVELQDKVLGIIGLGKIGAAVAQRARGLGMRVLACDPFVSAAQARAMVGVTLLELEQVLSQADFVTLHAALTTGPHATRQLIGPQELALLKPEARLVNCARGELIDEAALLAALNERRLAGAALDVFSQEPIGEHSVLRQLLTHPRVIATPHLGASTVEAQQRAALEVARAIIAVLRDEPAPRSGGRTLSPSAANAPLNLAVSSEERTQRRS